VCIYVLWHYTLFCKYFDFTVLTNLVCVDCRNTVVTNKSDISAFTDNYNSKTVDYDAGRMTFKAFHSLCCGKAGDKILSKKKRVQVGQHFLNVCHAGWNSSGLEIWPTDQFSETFLLLLKIFSESAQLLGTSSQTKWGILFYDRSRTLHQSDAGCTGTPFIESNLKIWSEMGGRVRIFLYQAIAWISNMYIFLVKLMYFC
jgi:hypothetical protein